MIPAVYDFTLVRGTTDPLIVRLKVTDGATPPVLTNLTFDEVQLTVCKKSKNADGEMLFRKKLSDGLPGFEISDSGEAEVTWTPTPEESRLLPIGPKADYELEVRNGMTQQVYLTGTITGAGGINADD